MAGSGVRGIRVVALLGSRGSRKDAERELRRLLRALDTGEPRAYIMLSSRPAACPVQQSNSNRHVTTTMQEDAAAKIDEAYRGTKIAANEVVSKLDSNADSRCDFIVVVGEEIISISEYWMGGRAV